MTFALVFDFGVDDSADTQGKDRKYGHGLSRSQQARNSRNKSDQLLQELSRVTLHLTYTIHVSTYPTRTRQNARANLPDSQQNSGLKDSCGYNDKLVNYLEINSRFRISAIQHKPTPDYACTLCFVTAETAKLFF
jgi:hypothetical protein